MHQEVKDEKIIGAPVYNVLHNEHDVPGEESHEVHDNDDDDRHMTSEKHSKLGFKAEVLESLDFQDCESMMWRKVFLFPHLNTVDAFF